MFDLFSGERDPQLGHAERQEHLAGHDKGRDRLVCLERLGILKFVFPVFFLFHD